MLPNPMQTPPIGGMAPMNTTPPMNMMPPMPPMGKMPPMEMNLDPMARQNFNNLMSGIQSQSMIPPMPMRMNEGGSVNPLMALIQGLGRLFGFGGGQEPSRGMSFGDAFAKARREGKKVFEYNGKMYTTELKEEQAARIEKEQNEKNKVEQVVQDVVNQYGGGVEQQLETETDPTSAMTKRDSVADLLIQAQQSKSDTPTMGDEFDVQRRGPEDFAPMPQFTGFDPKVTPGGRPVPLRQGDEFLVAAAADAPNVKIPGVKYDPNDEDYGAYFDYVRSQTTPGLTDTSGELGSLLESSPEPIEAQLNALMNISNQQPNLPAGLTRGVKPLGLGEKIQSLLQNLQRMGLSDKLSSSIKDKLDLLGMKGGGSVTDAIAKLEKGGEPKDAEMNAIIKALIGTSRFPTENPEAFIATGTAAAALPFKDRLQKMLMSGDYDFLGRERPDYMVDYKPLNKKKILMDMLKRGLGTAAKGSSILAGFTPKMMADASLPESMIVNKNQGGVVPIQGFTNGGSPTENVKPFFDKDNIFENVLDKFNQTFGPADTGTGGGQYASAKDQAAAENKGKSFFGATSYSYPIGDNILRLSTPTSTGDPFGNDANPNYSENRLPGTPGGAKPDIANMTQEEAQAYITTMAPTTRGFTGDYSNLDTFKNYTFYDKNFQFDDFKQAAEIAGYGQENKLASDKNIASGAATGTYRQEGEDVVDDDDDVVDDTNLGTDTGTTMTSTATTPISPFAQIEQATVVPSTRTVDASFNPSFTPLASTDIYNPNFLTDMPDFSALSIDPSQSAAVDLQKFLDIDEDKTAPKAFTPDTTNITDIMKASGYQQGGAVSPGLNMAIDKFISAYS